MTDPDIKAPTAFGPYAPAVRRGNFVFTPGVVGYYEDKSIDPDFPSQVRRAFANLEASLAYGGATLADVVATNVFISDAKFHENLNDLYMEFVKEPYPVRTTVIAGLKPGVFFEINAQAILTD